MGLSENLVEANANISQIKSEADALINFANAKTGAGDTNLGDAVKTLVDGFGQGGGSGENTLKALIAQTKMTYYLFYNYPGKTVDLSMFTPDITSLVENYASMFYGSQNLESLDISHFSFENARSLAYMFANNRKVPELDFSNANAYNITSMQQTFWNMVGLIKLDLTGIDFSKIVNGANTYQNCTSLLHLKIGKETDTEPQKLITVNAFASCPTEMRIYVPAHLVDAYKVASNWSTYADRIISNESWIPIQH